MIKPAISHLILPNLILEIMDIKKAYPYAPKNPGGAQKDFITIVELGSTNGILEVQMPFKEFKTYFEKALGVHDVKNN